MAFFPLKPGIYRTVFTQLLIIGILPLCILAGVFSYFYISGKKQAAGDVQKEVAEKIAWGITAHLKTTAARAAWFADSVRNEFPDQRRLQDMADEFLNQAGEYDWIILTDADGNELVKSSRFYTYRPHEFGNLADSDAFRTARTGKRHFSRIVISRTSHFPQIQITLPVTDPHDRFIGALCVAVNVSRIWTMISRYRLGDNRYAYVVDADGVLIAYQDLSMVLEQRNLRNIPAVREFLEGLTGVREYVGLNGERVIGAVAGVEVPEWAVIVEEAVATAYRDLRAPMLIFAAVWAITLLGALVLGLRFSSRRIIQPIRQLKKEAAAIAKGDLGRRIHPISTGDEFGELAEAFNRMVSDLRKTTVSRNRLLREIEVRREAEADRIRLATALEQAAEAVIVTDAQTVVQYVNPAFETLFGYSRREVMGRRISMLQSGKHDKAFYRDLMTTITAGRVWAGHFINRRKDGTLHEMEATISPIRDTRGRIVNYVSVQRDVTRERQMERQLQQTHKMEAIGTLAGGIAHDFNNILTAIMGFTEICIEDAPAGSLIHANLQEVLAAACRARDLVTQILTFCRQADQDLRPMMISVVIKEALKLMRATLPATIELRSRIDSESWVLADPTQMHQILINLCTNAAHAMQDAGGVLEVHLKDVRLDKDQTARYGDIPAGEYVMLTVSDSGPGISPDVLGRIFDPFFTTKAVGEGTGMGLAVVHGIVTACKGAVIAENKAEAGALFEVVLPVIDADDTAAPRTTPPAEGGGSLLLIDDEAAIAEMGRQMFSRLGYRVRVFTGARDALAFFQADPGSVDAVLTDMTMPDMTGKQLAEQLTAIRPDIPVILCTGYSDQIPSTEARIPGVRHVVQKPYSMLEMARILNELLTGGH